VQVRGLASRDELLLTQIGLIVSVTKEDVEEGKPTVFTAKQIPTVNSLPAAVPARASSRQEINWSFRPVKVRIFALGNPSHTAFDLKLVDNWFHRYRNFRNWGRG
jgi:hypothetical protein